MMNMLIALMSKTFDDVFEQQVQNAHFLHAQLVLSWHDSTTAPPPFNWLQIIPWLISQRHVTPKVARSSMPNANLTRKSTVSPWQVDRLLHNIKLGYRNDRPTFKYSTLDEEPEAADLDPTAKLQVAQGMQTDYIYWGEKYDIKTLVESVENHLAEQTSTKDEVCTMHGRVRELGEQQRKALEELRSVKESLLYSRSEGAEGGQKRN